MRPRLILLDESAASAMFRDTDTEPRVYVRGARVWAERRMRSLFPPVNNSLGCLDDTRVQYTVHTLHYPPCRFGTRESHDVKGLSRLFGPFYFMLNGTLPGAVENRRSKKVVWSMYG
ncbi:hypothetical protein J6590_030864 [Homalodisca vitripennis]|nr:hypothetical protein J6590_030864 [Homalodisca vitripennis]